MSRKTISYAEETALKYINDFGREVALSFVDDAIERWKIAKRNKTMLNHLSRVRKHIERMNTERYLVNF